MMYYEYKGYMIYPTPRLVPESGSWKVHLAIRWKNRIEFFGNGSVLPTKPEAVFTSIDYGKKLIDEGILLDEAVPAVPA